MENLVIPWWHTPSAQKNYLFLFNPFLFLLLYASHVNATESFIIPFHYPNACDMGLLFKSCIRALYYVKQTVN